MIIGIDASRFSSEASTGVEFYSHHIITEILRLSNTAPPWRDTGQAVAAGNTGLSNNLSRSDSVGNIILYTPRKLNIRADQRVMPFPRFWTQIRLSYEMLINPPDILFVPSHVIPLIYPKKTVTMIHDVAFKYLRNSYSFFQYYYLNFSAWFACKFAYKILVPTNAVKQDLVRFYNCDSKKIFVVPHGFEPPVAPEGLNTEEETKILRRFGIGPDQKYILFIGRLEEKKNLVRLVRAFNDFLKKHSDWRLILAGKRGLGFEKIWRGIDASGLWNKVLMPGYIEETEKHILLKNCEIFALPSLQEGFGFPILEAFYYKKPLITSDILAIREVAEDAAVFINPYKEKEIADGLVRLVKDKALCEKLAEAGLKQVKKFKWETSAKKTLKILLS